MKSPSRARTRTESDHPGDVPSLTTPVPPIFHLGEMSDDKKSWWSSVPGLLTAATGLVAALSGLVAGLNQTGLLDRFRAAQSKPETVAVVRTDSQPPQPIVPPEESAPEHTSAPPRATTTRPPTRPATRAPQPAASLPAPAPATPAATSRTAVLPSGTVLELAASEEICSASARAGDRFGATLVAAVQGKGRAMLPAGTRAVLSVQRLPAPNFLGARLDSIMAGGTALPISKSDARPRREVVKGKGGSKVGACIREGGRIRVTLGAPLKLPGA
jgi:hypothetical protein